MQLITIRNRTFSEGVNRSTTDYTEWDESRDHPTAYYPDSPPRIYPQRYSIKNQADPDRCQKEVNESKIFIEGLMTVGCSCRQNIMLGFELMLMKEFPRASPSATPSGKGLYLTVYPLSSPNTDTI